MRPAAPHPCLQLAPAGCCWLLATSAATATTPTTAGLLLAAAGCCWLPTHSAGPSHTHQVMRPAAKSDAPSGATPTSAAGGCWLLLAAGCGRLVLRLLLLRLLLGCWR